jgi:hypothetical protein
MSLDVVRFDGPAFRFPARGSLRLYELVHGSKPDIAEAGHRQSVCHAV